MVQAADLGHDRPRHGERDRSEVGCVLVQRKVGARLMVIGEVPGQDAAEVPGLRGLGRRLGMRRETVRSATSMPSLRSSPWIRLARDSNGCQRRGAELAWKCAALSAQPRGETTPAQREAIDVRAESL
jgi:hypothetical protein